jgi:hypothetical protein
VATSPQFAGTINNGVAVIGTNGVDATNRDGTGATTAAPVSGFSAGGSGSKVEEIVVKADKDPADCTILIFIYDGSTHHLFDEWDIGNPAAGSATVASYREARQYENLVLKTGWSIRFVVTAAPTSGSIRCHVFGGDL